MSKWIKHTPPDTPELLPSTIVIVKMKEDKMVLNPLRVQDIDWDCPGDEVSHYKVVDNEQGG